MKTIVVLGGTGHFGGIICRRLAGEPNTRLIVTSRNASAAERLAASLKLINPDYEIRAVALDQHSATFEADIKKLSPDIVIHTAGPYQNQGYLVAEACINCGSHYIDLADGREFVLAFDQLDERAKSAGVLLVAGASTLPGLSTCVIDNFKTQFQLITQIAISIAPAHQTPRGPSTIAAVLSYCGAPIRVYEEGTWVIRYGWQDLRRQWYPALGRRLSAACDVPDLALLPGYLPGVRSVTFHAALEARWEQLALWCMAGLTRMKLILNWGIMIPLFHYVSEKMIGMGSQKGCMHLLMSGTGTNGKNKEINWYLTAENNHGPEIPCSPALILARKLARDEITTRGAMPCLGMFSLADFDAEIDKLDISWELVD